MLEALFTPEEEKKPLHRGTAFFRILVLVILIGLGYGIYTFHIYKKPDTKIATILVAPKSAPVGDVLGAFITSARDDLMKNGNNLVRSTVENAKTAATHAVIQTTVSTVLSEINKLPKSQRNEVKAALCK